MAKSKSITRRKAKARPRRKAEPAQYAYRRELPFAPKGSWWKVEPTGIWETDYRIGQQYAMAFWRVSGDRGTCGIDLPQILVAMHPDRHRPAKQHRKLSGIEVGFLRTIGEVVDMLTMGAC